MRKCDNFQFQLPIGSRFGHWLLATLVALATFAITPAARAEQPAYTNHAGNAVPGIVVALVVDGKEVVRPLTAEDVDTIGKACLFNSVNI